MFKTLSPKGQATRERVFDAALRLFRADGFEAATMRDIAAAAGLSLGAAYHYFPSKESLVMAYYLRHQEAHAADTGARLARTTGTAARLKAVVHSKLDLLQDDRRLLGALLRYGGEPNHPLSFFGPDTAGLRQESVALFDRALDRARVPADLAAATSTAFWALQMGLILFALHDSSVGLARTRRLADGAMDLAVGLLAVVRLAPFAPLRRRLVALIKEAGLVVHPTPAPGPPV